MAKENENPVSELLARLNKQQQNLSRQKEPSEDRSSGTSSATDPYGNTEPTASIAGSDERPDAAEVLRLQKELELAKERMAQMDLELTQSRITKHTVEEAIGSPFPGAQQLAFNIGGVSSNAAHGRVSPYRRGGLTQQEQGTGIWLGGRGPAGHDAFVGQK